MARLLSPRMYVLLLCIAVWAYFIIKLDIPGKINAPPGGEHIWAQCDRASQAKCFYEEDLNIFLPRTHSDPQNNGGYAAGEFPLLNFMAALGYRIFGPHEWIYRLLIFSLSILLVSVWVWQFSQIGGFMLITGSMLATLNPNFIYYSLTFVPDPVAYGLVLCAAAFLYRFTRTLRYSFLYIFAACVLLGGLIKVSSVLITGSMLLPATVVLWKSGKIKYVWLAFFVPALICAAWVIYARMLNEQYESIVFMMRAIRPSGWTEAKEWMHIWYGKRDAFYPREIYYSFPLLLVFVTVFHKRLPRYWLILIYSSLLSFVFFFFMMMGQIHFHQYYFLPFQPAFSFLVFGVIYILESFSIKKAYRIAGTVLLCVALNYNNIHAKKMFSGRWEAFRETRAYLYTLEDFLREKDIQYSDRVLSFPDGSSNISLYFMNRKGVALSDISNVPSTKLYIETCAYAIIRDSAILVNPEYRHYFEEKIGETEGSALYKIRRP